MKRVICHFLFLLFFIPCLSVASSQVFDEIPIYVENPSGNQPHAPAIVPLSCYVSSAMNELFLVSNVLSETVHVYVENTTTGNYTSEDVLLNSFPSPVSLFGQGEYLIEIMLQSGVIFYGSFYL